MQAKGDEALSGTRRGVEDDVVAVHQLEERFLLGRVGFEPRRSDPIEESVEDCAGVRESRTQGNPTKKRGVLGGGFRFRTGTGMLRALFHG